MKKLMIIALLFVVTTINAQFTPFDDGNTVTGNIGLFSSGAILEDGFNYGIKTTFNFSNSIYVAPEIFIFPELRGNNYFHFGTGVGYNVIHTQSIRAYIGILGTVVLRDKNSQLAGPNGGLGFNAGIEWTIPTTSIYVGTWFNYQYRTDTAPTEDNYWRESVFVELGVRLF